ncbi:MAG: hypothetical protein JRN57_04645 [Nitrososphaerota archaeon]|nr:hypothetical protein [Nitrososphaerota archaeon]
MKRYLAVVLLDAVLLVALFYVLGDIQWRAAYAGSAHARTTGYAVSISYSLFTKVFTMAGNGVTLASPLTLDWVQVLAGVLVAANAWLLYNMYVGRTRRGHRGPTDQGPARTQ